MTLETKLPFDQEYIRNYSKELGEPGWLLDLRLQAFSLFEGLELPKPDKTKIDNWNFTSFKNHVVKGESIQSIDALPEHVKTLVDLDNQKQNILVQLDQGTAFTSIQDELKSKGVIFTDIHTAAREHSDLLQKYFMKDAVKVDEHKLTALHAAFVNGGAFVYVPKNVEVEVPLQAIYVQNNSEASMFNHVIIVAEDNSAVTYVENYISSSSSSDALVNIVTEVMVGTNAKVTFGAVDNLAAGITTYVNRRGMVGRDGKLEWALGLMNDGNTISENITHLVGDGSYGDTKTVTVGRGEQKQNFTTSVIHHGKHSEGYILKHGVMKESASSIFNGIGKIEHGATKANAEQTSRVLMLSEKARGDANPILLIDEDDVTAGHAASVGRVDPLQLYYLMSRGIPQVEAERLVIHGFLAPVVNELPIEGVKKQLVEVIERKVR
ncbi:Fe-S cluster assembly protein SufD [Bacillus salitolerans]|uniref:Fe-S cluster assembly protein SufD n=1 Tax=Bacillus salitolerans TaxID=1437434 RepID=A0ABW4LUB8_9BACI